MAPTEDQVKLLLAYIQCVEGKADWTKMANIMGLSSGAAAQARFQRLQSAYKNTDVKVGDGTAKNGRGPTAVKGARVSKRKASAGAAGAKNGSGEDGDTVTTATAPAPVRARRGRPRAGAPSPAPVSASGKARMERGGKLGRNADRTAAASGSEDQDEDGDKDDDDDDNMSVKSEQTVEEAETVVVK